MGEAITVYLVLGLLSTIVLRMQASQPLRLSWRGEIGYWGLGALCTFPVMLAVVVDAALPESWKR